MAYNIRWVAIRLKFGATGIAVNHITPRFAALLGITHGLAPYRTWCYAQECVETASQRIVVVISEAVVVIGIGLESEKDDYDDDYDNDNDFDKPEHHAIALGGNISGLI